ncbi:Dedicator of cytokinesis protein 9 [Holothuria leucospilota]|uniref:Dedicator of cytokinesis protein 9 n=1 Tax=Holothuria leucospilota TaxID=206669 RepID=A0A9Q1BR32_HOLLE|nr:Dedicator of cytokinesis protein 9 [Holothuria leucospilota]
MAEPRNSAVRRSVSDRRDTKVNVTRTARSGPSKVAGQKVEATMKALMEASEKKKPARTISSSSSSPTCENPDLKEELLLLKKQGLASGRSNSSSSINSTSSLDGTRRGNVAKKSSHTLPTQQTSSGPTVRKTSAPSINRVSHPRFKPPDIPPNKTPLTKANLTKSNLSNENGINANLKTSQESLNSNKSDLMNSILKDWEASKKTTTTSAGPHKARMGQIKRELSDVKTDSSRTKKTSPKSLSSPDSEKSGEKPVTNFSSQPVFSKPRESAAARAAQLKRERASANKRETMVTKVTTSSSVSSTANRQVTSRRMEMKVTKKEEIVKKDGGNTTQKVVSIRGGGGKKQSDAASKRETWHEGSTKDDPEKKHKEAMEDLKSSLTKALFSDKKDEVSKPVEPKKAIKTTKFGGSKGSLALSDLQNQNYIEACTSSESSEVELEKGVVKTRTDLLKSKKVDIVKAFETSNDTDSDGEIGLGIPYSILKLPGVEEEGAGDKTGTKKEELFFQRGKNGSVKRASLLIEKIHGSSSAYTFPDSKEVKGSTGSEEASGDPVEVDFTVEKLALIDPVDYENHLIAKKTQLNADPMRLMLLFPHDDVSASTIPRQLRTVRTTIPEGALKEAQYLFVKECINHYNSEWKVINQKYAEYSGDFHELPCYTRTVKLPDQRYEVDEAEDDRPEDSMLSPSGSIFKYGFLLKTPFGNRAEMRLLANFKRRWFFLKQLPDKSFLLEYYKDDKSNISKGTLNLDSLVEVQKSQRSKKFGMELHMQDGTIHVIAAESEEEMVDWYETFQRVIEQQKIDSNSDKQSLTSLDDLDHEYADDVSPSDSEKSQNKMNFENSRHLTRYSKESERTNAQKRTHDRQKLFSLFPRMMVSEKALSPPEPKPYEEEFKKRFMLELQALKFKLCAVLNADGNIIENPPPTAKSSNIEPFFTSLSLFDAQNSCKISEDFHVDINTPQMRKMLDFFKSTVNGSSSPTPETEKPFTPSTIPSLIGVDPEWLKYPFKGIFSVRKPNPEIYIVLRVEKILQGNIQSCAEPYIKPGDMIKTCQKVNKQANIFCSRLTQYRMPFAWAAKPIFNDVGEVDLKSEFTSLYRQDSSKPSDEDLLKMLQDLKRNPEKLTKLTEIPGTVEMKIEPCTQQPSNSLTPSLAPLMPWPEKPQDPPILEVEEFPLEIGKFMHPHTVYLNNLFVYPLSLKYDSQKTYAKARNIAIVVQFKDSDDEDAHPLKCIYGRPGGNSMEHQASVSVLHHQQTPEFYEEIKIALPTHLHEKHHLLFKFYHVSCETGKGTVKKRDTVDSFVVEPLQVGYAWLPILQKDMPSVGEKAIPVSSTLPPRYLSAKKDQATGKSSGPEIKWVDGGKELLRLNLKLKSTIYTQDQHLNNFFVQCSTWDGNQDTGLAIIQSIKAMHAVESHIFINFLPVILNQLFHLLAFSQMEDLQKNVVRLIVYIISQVAKEGREDVLHSYVKFVFETETNSKRAVHEDLVTSVATLLLPSTDSWIVKPLMKHLWFFFAILIKSMAQHLIKTDTLGNPRHKRFQPSFEQGVRHLVQVLGPHILHKYKEHRDEAKEANYHLAHFIKVNCFTYMDRGFVFRLINCYLESFQDVEYKPLYEMKFEMIRVLCQHEHYIALNLPLQKKGQVKHQLKTPSYSPYTVASSAYSGQMRRYVPLRYGKDQFKDIKYDYTLTEEFCREHFLAGLVLREVGFALHDVTEVRQCGIKVLRNLLAKHSFDDRYTSKQHQQRIAALYLPFLSIILSNVSRLSRDGQPPLGPAMSISGDQESELDRNRLGSDRGHERSNSIGRKSASLQRDSNVLDIIAGRGTNSSSTDVILRQSPTDRRAAHRLSWLSLSDSSGYSSPVHSPVSPTSRPFSFAKSMSPTPKGTTALPNLRPLGPTNRSGSNGSMNSSSSSEKTVPNGTITNSPSLEMDRSDPSRTSRNKAVMYDKLLDHEIKDLLICLLYIVKNVSEEVMLAWWTQASEEDQLKFFELMELSLQHFKYPGKKAIFESKFREKSNMSAEERSRTAPTRGSKQIYTKSMADFSSLAPDNEAAYRVQQEANLATEVGLTVLDIIGVYCSHFKAALDANQGDNPLMKKVTDIHLGFLRSGQSEVLLRHAFASIRVLLNKFPIPIFKGATTICADLCLAILKNMNSRIQGTRQEACGVLYLLMRNNFEHTQRRDFNRVHLQVVVAVAKLIAETNGARFQESLAIINNYANTDKHMQNTSFPSHVRDLTKKIRSVLMATAQMKEHENNPEVLVDLQYSLAKSYSTTPELRRTWLESMANIHINHGNYSEAAQCHIHSAALIAEYLKRINVFPDGVKAFKDISPNVEGDEKYTKSDEGLEEMQYQESDLLDQLEKAAELLLKAERHETMDEVYKLINHFYKKNRDFQKLAFGYLTLSKSFETVYKLQGTGKRLLGSYFRVAFFGQHFDDDDGKEYIYKEPKITTLTTICQRLEAMYQEKFGKDHVHLIRDSVEVKREDLDPKLAHIQVTFVKPHFDEQELLERVTEYERCTNIRRFVFETPYTQGGKARGAVEEQCKRKTILTTSHTFPYVKKRVQVMYHHKVELNPIQVAIEELNQKVMDMETVLNADAKDMKKLQLLLQGSVSVQVNAGPQAYAAAFLGDANEKKWNSKFISELKQIFRDFVRICGIALEVNATLIKEDQVQYHEDMDRNYRQMVINIGELMGEKLLDDELESPGKRRASASIFNAISGTP